MNRTDQRVTAVELESYVREKTIEYVVSESGRGKNKHIDYQVGTGCYVAYDHGVQIYSGPDAQEALDAFYASWRQGGSD